MKILFGIALCLLSAVSLAQPQSALDGNWLRKSIDAFERVNDARTGTAQDATDSTLLIFYISGMLAVHRQNNLTALLLLAVLTPTKGQQQTKPKAAEADMQMRVAFVFTPLLAIPDALTAQQVVTILRNHLDKHPEQWDTQAPLLITDALKQAFSRK